MGCFRMIEEYVQTIGYNRGYLIGLNHEEKMGVIVCLLDECAVFYVNNKYTAWISERCIKLNYFFLYNLLLLDLIKLNI